MSQFVFDVITKLGKLVKGGNHVTADEARTIALAFAKRNGYQPQIVAITVEETEEPQPINEPKEMAVATQLWSVDVARYIWRHQRAIMNTDAKDKDGNVFAARFHWSALIMKALKGGRLQGEQQDWLMSIEKEVRMAVATSKRYNKTYLLLDPDNPIFSFGN